MQPAWSMCRWPCARRFFSSAYRTCQMWTQCTSIPWNGSLLSSWLPLPTLREQEERSTTVNTNTNHDNTVTVDITATKFVFMCFLQTRWRTESLTSMNSSPSVCTVMFAAVCLKSTSSCLPSSFVLASWWMRTKLTWWETGVCSLLLTSQISLTLL